MRALRPLTFAALVALILDTPGVAQISPADAAAAVEASTSDKSPGAFLIGGNEGSWSLVSDGKDSRLIARLGWQSVSGEVALGIESSASLQEEAPETEFLNLDGLASGDTSVTGQISFRRFFERRRETLLEGGELAHGVDQGDTRASSEGMLLSVCEQVNLAIEKQIREERGDAEPLHGGTCTLEALENVGGTWSTEADKVTIDSQAWACNELAKLNPDIVLTLPNASLKGLNAPETRFGKTGDCTDKTFIEAAERERAQRESSSEVVDIKAKAEVAKKERASLLDRIAANDAAFAAASDATQREKLARERLDLEPLVGVQERIIAEGESLLESHLPKLIMKPAEVLAAKRAELLGAACRRYNEPDRSAELVLIGFDQGCELGRIEKAITGLSDPRVRDRLRWAVVANLPAAVWAVTLRAGMDNKDFKFVDAAALPNFATFDELTAGVKSESDIDSLFGVAATLQHGVNFLRIGYDLRNVHNGGTPAEACAPAGLGSTVQRCTSVILGQPKGSEENVATIEYRRLLTSRLGLSGKAFFLHEAVRNNKVVSSEWEGRLTLYFLAHATRGLNGGVDIAYDTVVEDVRARLFIGQSFNLFD
jgi:hypothetical protein